MSVIVVRNVRLYDGPFANQRSDMMHVLSRKPSEIVSLRFGSEVNRSDARRAIDAAGGDIDLACHQLAVARMQADTEGIQLNQKLLTQYTY